MYCLCVNVYCHRVTTQLQLTNISSYHINSGAVQCNTNWACDMGSHMAYRVYVTLYKIIGLVIQWPVIMSKWCVKVWNEIFKCLKCVIVWELITGSQALAAWHKTRCIHNNVRTAVDMSIQWSWYIFLRCYWRSDSCRLRERRVLYPDMLQSGKSHSENSNILDSNITI
jgi:hypothetical protein